MGVGGCRGLGHGRVAFTVSSFYHEKGRIDLADLNREHRPYDAAQAYNDSKLADLMFALELQRRLTTAGSAVRSYAAHPGLASTDLLSRSRSPQSLALRFLGQGVDQGALPILFAATQNLPGGSYVGPGGFRHLRGYPELATPSKAAQDPEMGRRLWTLASRLTSTASDLPTR